jgi:oxaloacetate decarboxylase alpha subunit
LVSAGPIAVAEAVPNALGAEAILSDDREHPGTWLPVISPMVGTFYAAPAPDKPPFVQVGDEVVAGQPLCIVEAMKLMNEIDAEQMGTIREVCVENAMPVEYGTVLFYLEPTLD